MELIVSLPREGLPSTLRYPKVVPTRVPSLENFSRTKNAYIFWIILLVMAEWVRVFSRWNDSGKRLPVKATFKKIQNK